jgi:hypothetical protein
MVLQRFDWMILWWLNIAVIVPGVRAFGLKVNGPPGLQ